MGKRTFRSNKRASAEPRLVSLTFSTKAALVPLQVADLIAYYMTKWQRRNVFYQGKKLQKAALWLTERAREPYRWFAMEHFGPERLNELAERGAAEIKMLSTPT